MVKLLGMMSLRKFLFAAALCTGLFFFASEGNKVQAQVFSCSLNPAVGTQKTYASDPAVNADYHAGDSVTFTVSPSTPNWKENISNFEIWVCLNNDTAGYCAKRAGTINENSVTANIPATEILPQGERADFYVVLKDTSPGKNLDLCKFESAFTMINAVSTIGSPACSMLNYSPKPILRTTSSVTVSYDTAGLQDNQQWQIRMVQSGSGAAGTCLSDPFTLNTGTKSVTCPIDAIKGGQIFLSTANTITEPYCQINLIYDPNTGETGGEGESLAAEFALCEQTADAGSQNPNSDYQQCRSCFGAGVGSASTGDTNPPKGFWTAFGCVETSAEGIVTSFLRIGLGIAGGFVLLSILYGAFLLTTSSGDPKRVQEGQEMVTSAIMGLFFVIFSIIILRFLGVTLLRIPGFGA